MKRLVLPLILLANIVRMSAQAVHICGTVPDEVESITLYTQNGTRRGVTDPDPYVVRFQDRTARPILGKRSDKVLKTRRKVPVGDIAFDGFVLERIGPMQDDAAAQRASAAVTRQGLHDYGKRDTPVYCYKRRTWPKPPIR